MQGITPATVPPPFGRYSHATMVPPGWRMLRTSGQLGLELSGTVPPDVEGQSRICFRHIDRILAEAGMTSADVAHITAWLVDRADLAAYMRCRDAFVGPSERLPASTALNVSGFTRPEFRVEIEVMACAPQVTLPPPPNPV